jgi:urease accessory protein
MSTPSAARAFMMKHAGRAVCRQRLEVGAGGWLEYAPEPLYPHRDSDYLQRTTLEVAAGGEACFTESFSPGRVGLGELWAWRRLALHLDVRIAGRPALRERLDASGEEIGRMAAFHGRDEAWFSTTVVVSSRAAQDGTLWNRVRDLHRDGTWVGATRLHDTMWVVRAVARGGLALRDFQSELRELLAVAIPAHCCDLRKL